MAIKYKSMDTEININETKMIIDGFFSVTGNVDKYDEVMVPGALKKTLAYRRKHWEFFHVNDHNYRFHIADVLEIEEEPKGGYFKSKFFERERELFEQVINGDFNGMSFAYYETKARYENEEKVINGETIRTGINYIEEIDLIEISSTRWPVNPLARAAEAKSITREMFFEFARHMTEEDRVELKSLINAPDTIIKNEFDLLAWAEDMKALI